jgi:ribosome biogenesis protein NSA2
MERWRKLHGRRLDTEERLRKKTAREGHKASKDAQNLRGLKAKLHAKKRHHEKIQMKKQIKAHEERNVKTADEKEPSTPMPSYLLDRTNPSTAKALSSAIKNKRSEKAAKFSVPIPQSRGISEQEMFSVVKTGKKQQKRAWKRVVTKVLSIDTKTGRVRMLIHSIADVCWARLYTPQPQVRALHSAHGFTYVRSQVETLRIV